MQKDFHYDVIYVLAIWAGFDSKEAFTIAYASQYVDDANNNGRIKFTNKASYTRTSSAHETLDIENNRNDIENHNTWLPFHFLPGNAGYERGQTPTVDFEDLLVCTQNSYVARDMIKEAIKSCNKENGLHRFGIALHTYADTWAHHGFIGAVTDKNKVRNIRYKLCNEELTEISVVDKLENRGIDDFLPVGHGPALTNPDMPFFEEWRFEYFDERGEQIFKNTESFLEAADTLIKVMRLFQVYRKNSIILDDDLASILTSYQGLDEEQKDVLNAAFNTIQDLEGDERHSKWSEWANDGTIPNVGVVPEYFAKGQGSWKYMALGTERLIDDPEELFEYTAEFLKSDWKKFHDALQEQRQYILLELLPAYGICVS